MALQPCTECKAEISDKAASCPHCGAPVLAVGPTERTKVKKEGYWGLIGLLVFGVLIWKSCSSDATSQKATPAVVAEVSPATPAASNFPKSPEPQPEPMHHYSLKDHGEYGYEAALSDDDNKRGLATKPLIMARYLGEKDGTQRVEIREGMTRTVFSCEGACEFVKVNVLFDGETINTQRLKNIPGSIMNAVLDDAMSGQLEVYKSTAKTPIKKSPVDVTEE